jgi:hypothetical protein
MSQLRLEPGPARWEELLQQLIAVYSEPSTVLSLSVAVCLLVYESQRRGGLMFRGGVLLCLC